MEKIPQAIFQPFQEEKKAIGGLALGLTDIVKMSQVITSSQRTFMCIDALDECARVQRVKILNSLNQILENSPRTRPFMTGRHHLQAEIEKRFTWRVISVPVSPKEDDIIRYLRSRLSEDWSLEDEILEKTPETISEMCEGAMVLRILHKIIR